VKRFAIIIGLILATIVPFAAKAGGGNPVYSIPFEDSTGTGTTKEYRGQVREEGVAILAGFRVNENGVRTWEQSLIALKTPTDLDFRVTDGKISIVSPKDAKAEFCRRASEAPYVTIVDRYGFGATPCDQNSRPIYQVFAPLAYGGNFVCDAQRERRVTGTGTTLCFNAGESVTGFRITLNDGRTFQSCSFNPAPKSGKILDGVINPFPEELAQRKPCDQPIPTSTPLPPTRRQSGPGKAITFVAGEPVLGFKIVLNNGTSYTNCYLASPPSGGSVFEGVVNPFKEEVAKMTPCTVPDPTQTPTSSPTRISTPVSSSTPTATATSIASATPTSSPSATNTPTGNEFPLGQQNTGQGKAQRFTGIVPQGMILIGGGFQLIDHGGQGVGGDLVIFNLPAGSKLDVTILDGFIHVIEVTASPFAWCNHQKEATYKKIVDKANLGPCS